MKKNTFQSLWATCRYKKIRSQINGSGTEDVLEDGTFPMKFEPVDVATLGSALISLSRLVDKAEY